MSEIFKTVKPEEVGVKSQNLKRFYEKIEEMVLTIQIKRVIIDVKLGIR